MSSVRVRGVARADLAESRAACTSFGARTAGVVCALFHAAAAASASLWRPKRELVITVGPKQPVAGGGHGKPLSFTFAGDGYLVVVQISRKCVVRRGWQVPRLRHGCRCPSPARTSLARAQTKLSNLSRPCRRSGKWGAPASYSSLYNKPFIRH